MLHATIESHKDPLCVWRGQPVHEPRVAVLLLDDDLDAGQHGGEAHGRRDVPAGADDDEGTELAEDPPAGGDGAEEAEGEDEVGEGEEGERGAGAGDGGEGEAGGGDCGGLEAGVGADEEDLGVGAGVLDRLRDGDRGVDVAPGAAPGEDDAESGGRRRRDLEDGREDDLVSLRELWK